MSLIQSVHFVAPHIKIWPDLVENKESAIAPSRLAELCVDSLDCWILRTYYELVQAGATVSLSSDMKPGVINVADVYATGKRNRGLGTFVVIPTADGHEPQLANFTVLQNATMTSSKPYVFIPHWPQPGIIPRDPSRGDKIEVVTFKGGPINLDPMFKEQAFLDQLAAFGIRLDLGRREGGHWKNYKNADLVLAVRNLTKYDASRKPASKLVNAWWADVPALLGPEPAFNEIGTSWETHIPIRSTADVIEAIKILRQSPQLYTQIVESGRQKRARFTSAHIVQDWINAFNEPIADEFRRWQKLNFTKRTLLTAQMMFKEPQIIRQHKDNFLSGERILR